MYFCLLSQFQSKAHRVLLSMRAPIPGLYKQNWIKPQQWVFMRTLCICMVAQMPLCHVIWSTLWVWGREKGFSASKFTLVFKFLEYLYITLEWSPGNSKTFSPLTSVWWYFYLNTHPSLDNLSITSFWKQSECFCSCEKHPQQGVETGWILVLSSLWPGKACPVPPAAKGQHKLATLLDLSLAEQWK